MSYNLLFDSSIAKLQPDNRDSKSHDFKIFFHPPIVLKPMVRHKAALDHGINNYIYIYYDRKDIMTLHFDISLCRTIFNIHPSYEVDLSQGDFVRLLGFDKKVISGAGVVGDRVPDITRGVDWVYIHCDLIRRRARDVESSVLFFSLPPPTS